ncbi:MAG: hypothetical protein LBF68_00855 [Christensenellaceae bacterium]|jgi:ABC-type molybdenum transport system ATPase subunit/photorepair protein PhrA|nr:hypothetical protein [Christensenellaceae bacterium]
MIKIIYGSKGSGKTKLIIDKANENIESECVGDVVFIADTSRYIHELKYHIRFTNTKEASINSEDGLLGFICGMMEANYDIRFIYIDGAARMIGKKLSEMESFYSRLEKLSAKTDCQFTLTVSADLEDIPDFIKQYID